MWPEIAVVVTGFAIGNTLFGHFEATLALLLVLPLIVHVWWLPKHGINGWTGEPREKYYALRGWKWSPAQ